MCNNILFGCDILEGYSLMVTGGLIFKRLREELFKRKVILGKRYVFYIAEP